MFLKRFYDERLAQASFLIGCQSTGEAVVIDANRDLAPYLEGAAAEGARITHVTETHIHADFVSGSRELAGTTGARLLLSGEGGADWQYAFAASDGATLLLDRSRFLVGRVAFDVMHTPGHTPEHLTFLVTDTPATDRPLAALTGDFIFAGDVGRPDLLERAARVSGTMESSARTLFRSLRRFRALPEYLSLWPGHGAGSACGKALGAMPQTTLGYELLANWAFQVKDEDAFVREVLAGQPEPPRYFADMKRVNRDGPAALAPRRAPQRLPATRLKALLDAGAIVIDTRRPDAFAAGHLAGTLSIPRSKSFSTYAGSLLPIDAELYLIVEDDRAGTELVRDLAMIGFDRVSGTFSPDSLTSSGPRHRALEAVAQLDVRDADRGAAKGELLLLDVRARSEWEAGHPPKATHIPLGELPERVAELPNDLPIAVTCQSGSRSAIAASLLLARGRKDVMNVPGGFTAWVNASLPISTT